MNNKASPQFHIVLIAPEIPQNTGTIGRLCVCTGARLHLVRPLGFSLDASKVRRAGLDYWQYLDLAVHDDWESFLKATCPERLVFLSTKTSRNVYTCRFRSGDCLIFGNETRGLPPNFYSRYAGELWTLPMPGVHARSHNLANAAAIVLYEALRQTHPMFETGMASAAGSQPNAHLTTSRRAD
ncbi:MAG: tRNA (cytidine(34)-2'-O)-methyltransferase [Kiritimatiellaeota bacterium]|nr:tRNA (cytidine(34)-2'-O)-methyltransferase [Kiritimatiellota bacterium]